MAREKWQKVECGKMWIRRSGSAGLATEKVEFVTKQRGCVFFFFLVLHSAWLFGSQQDPWLQFCLFLVLPKFGHIPLS